MPHEELLGEDLRSLDLRPCLGGTETRDPQRRHGVGEPSAQGSLGAHDHEVHAAVTGEARLPWHVLRRNWNALGHACDPGVAGSHERPVPVRPKRPGQRMLSSSTANDEDLHDQCRK